MTFSEIATASLHRRLDFADAWRYRLDVLLTALGCRRNHLLSDLPHFAGKFAFDLLESIRTGGHVSYPGRVHLAALAAPVRLPQGWRYRGYWYDPATHSLVGTHLGIDLHRHCGKYHLIESNTSPAMRPERRQLYDDEVDPLITELVDLAKTWKFERLVLIRGNWTNSEIQECKLASSRGGIDVDGVTLASRHRKRHPLLNPMLVLPEKVQHRTLYVNFTKMNRYSPVHYLMHNKGLVGTWLAETLADSGHPGARLAGIPVFDRVVLPAKDPDARWPNLVVKLADSDRAAFVAMGRFTTEAEARRELRLDDHPDAVPGVFRTALWQKVLNRLFPGTLKVIYQPFVPPEVVANRARRIRLHVFVSPLVNAFLSSHGLVGVADLPEELPPGLVKDDLAYVVSASRGGRRCRLPADMEDELREVAQEFGRCLTSPSARSSSYRVPRRAI